MPRLTLADFGRAVGLSRGHVSDLQKRNIVDLRKGMDQSIIDYCAHLREKAAGRSGGGDYDLTEERARLAFHQANIASLDEQVKAKKLIPFDVVVERWQHVLTNFRAKALSLPSSLAAVAAHAPKEDVHKAAEKLIKEMLEELAVDIDY